MIQGDKIWFIDVGRSGSLTAPTLPLSIYKGTVIGLGNNLIAAKTSFGTVCFDKASHLSQNFDYKMFENLKMARRILTQRRKRVEALEKAKEA